MTHPSLFALQHFVDTADALDGGEVAHVSACASCRATLARLAQRELERRGVEVPLAAADVRSAHSVSTSLAAFVAAAAVMAVMVTSHPVSSVAPPEVWMERLAAPEGVHGVAVDVASASHAFPAGRLDAGARLGAD